MAPEQIQLQALGKKSKLKDFNRLFGLDEHDTFVLVSRGQTYQAMGKKKGALNDYRKAVNLDPSQDWVKSCLDKLRRPTDER